MITTARIIQNNIGSDENNIHRQSNLFEIELPILYSSDDNPNDERLHMRATAAVPPGQYDMYQIGDIVYVGFMHNQISNPIIIGKVYKGVGEDVHTAASENFVNTLRVEDLAQLPENTCIGEIDFNELSDKAQSKVTDVLNILRTLNVDQLHTLVDFVIRLTPSSSASPQVSNLINSDLDVLN